MFLNGFKKCVTASVPSLTLQTAHSATMTSGQFLVLSSGGGTVGNFNDVTGNISGGTWSVASLRPFLGSNWTIHEGTTFDPGSYTFGAI